MVLAGSPQTAGARVRWSYSPASVPPPVTASRERFRATAETLGPAGQRLRRPGGGSPWRRGASSRITADLRSAWGRLCAQAADLAAACQRTPLAPRHWYAVPETAGRRLPARQRRNQPTPPTCRRWKQNGHFHGAGFGHPCARRALRAAAADAMPSRLSVQEPFGV